MFLLGASDTATLENLTVIRNSFTVRIKRKGTAVYLIGVGGTSCFSDNSITITGFIMNSDSYFDGVEIVGTTSGSIDNSQ